MDSLITAAARALAAGDPLGALQRVALREDPPALALRGIAMAQLGDFARARVLLRRAVRGFGPHEAVARARCVVAEAEVAFATRELGWRPHALAQAGDLLAARGDRINAAHARCLQARRSLLLGHLDDASSVLRSFDGEPLPPALVALHALVTAEIALRQLHVQSARNAMAVAADAARHAGITALTTEVNRAAIALDAPAARLLGGGDVCLLPLEEVARVLASGVLVIDAREHAVRRHGIRVALAQRPILFALARILGESWPHEAPRKLLIASVFRTRHADQTHRARLRVEVARLRAALGCLATVRATRNGFVLVPAHGVAAVVLAWPVDEVHAPVLALLADGQSWASSSLALALGCSQRTVQRALDALHAQGKVQCFGKGRARRWTRPLLPAIATPLLLPAPRAFD